MTALNFKVADCLGGLSHEGALAMAI